MKSEKPEKRAARFFEQTMGRRVATVEETSPDVVRASALRAYRRAYSGEWHKGRAASESEEAFRERCQHAGQQARRGVLTVYVRVLQKRELSLAERAREALRCT